MSSIEIRVAEDLVLDAGTVIETTDSFTVHPPSTSMIDQLIGYLDDRPYHYRDVQIQRLGVGLSALCVRWGSYLGTLNDAATALHPALPGLNKPQPEELGWLNNSEMKRLNIDISFNLFRLVQIFRIRGDHGLFELLSKAHDHLPMPRKHVPKNREFVNRIITSLALGSQVVTRAERGEISGLFETDDGETQDMTMRYVVRDDADRFLTNALTYHAWRNTSIEEIHAGLSPSPSLQPHQQRFTAGAQRRVLREVTANLDAALYTFDTLFDEHSHFEGLLTWPRTATALANSLFGSAVSDWSLTEPSSPVTLPK